MHELSSIRRALGIGLSLIMIMSGVALPWTGAVDGAYAKDVGNKNKQACDHCEMVARGDAPTDSSGNPYKRLANGAVYRGGNARSIVSENKIDYELDNDPNDFANPLPYGNVFVDTSRLSWSTPSNFTIDIKDDRFKWVAVDGKQFTDSTGTTKTTNDPLGSGFELKGRTPNNGGGLDDGAIAGGFIAYVGELKPYHNDIKAKADDNGFTNTIKAADGDYLYRIIYRDAATLADGTRGNVIMTMTQVDIETSMSVSESNPRTLTDKNGNEYSYTKAVMPIQGANTLRVAAGVVDSQGNWVNEPYAVVLTKDEVQTAVDAANTNLPSGSKLGQSIINEKAIRHTAGAAYTFDIQVVDSEGNPAVGTMAYAAKDLDLPSYQNIWGRESADPFMYSEGLSILSGSQSYALVPKYNHSNANKVYGTDGGWVPKGLTDSWDSPLDIQGGSGSNADGVSFRANGEKVLRDQNGLWKDSFFSYNEDTAADKLMWLPTGTIRDFRWNNINNARLRDQAELRTTELNDNVKKQLAGKVKDASGNPKAWDQITAADAVAYIKDGSYAVERNDANDSYDTSFAVLIDPKKTTFRWTGSSYNSGQAVSNLFDSTLFTYIEQTHGTGGGIYYETYDISDSCKVNRSEGTVTMGKGTDATVTVVPEDGYRIDTIKIGKKELENPRTFTPVYDTDGTVTKIKDHDGTEHAVSSGKVTITDATYGDITFEVNSGGSIDVTLPDMQDARHIHADFTADYYFYKVWKGSKEPTDLKMTATPFAFVFKDVVLPDGKYTISDNGNTFTDPKGNAYTLENNSFTVGEGSSAVVYYLEGNSLVTYKTDSVTGERTKDKTYTIRLDYVKNGEPVVFDVTTADANNNNETHVTKGTEDGYTIWKITYPEKGLTTKGGKVWKPLPIETAPSAHNINHVERNYWFVTEEAPGWSLVSYDNTKAEAAGHIDTAESRKEIYKEGSTGDISAWAQASTKDYTQAMSVIAGASEKNHAYMSVFNSDDNSNYSWGGKIVNVPALVVNVEKTWEDVGNEYNTRKDVWFHLDGTIEKDGKKTTVKDILPPQKLAVNNSENTAKLTWGKKEAYGDSYLSELSDYANVKVVGKASAIPDSEKYMQDTSNPHKYIPRSGSGTTYYINELADEDGLNNTITYSIRETDKDGNALKQYTVTTGKLEKDADPVKVDNIDVDSYTSKIKNELETVKIKATKVWADNENEYNLRKNVVFSLKADGTKVEDSEKTISKDAASAVDRTVEWTAPKYNENGGEIKYAVDEVFEGKQNIDPYSKEVTGSATDGYVITNKYPPQEENMTVTRTIIYTYIDENGETANKTVIQTVNLTRKPESVDPDTFEVTWGDWEITDTEPETDAVASPPIDGWNANKDIPEWDIDLSDPKDAWEHVIYTPDPPEGTLDETYGLKGQPQTGTPSFKVSTPTTPDGSKNEIVDIKLVDPETGNLLTEVRVPEGTYKLNENGTVTFTPLDPNFTGDPTPIKLKGTDKNGLSAETTYIPHIKESEEKGEASRTIHYTYLTREGETASKDVVQTVKLIKKAKSIDPKTGEVEWGPWEDPDNPGQSAKFPAVPNPDDVDENTWTPDSSAQEQTVTEPGTVPDVHIVYTKEPYTVIYHNGIHGKSDGKGNQKDEDYGNKVTGGNGVTPDKGWHFTGTYTYVIKDKNGKTIGVGSTKDPTSVEITGNIEFTPAYAPNKYTIKYDANGGSGSMTTQKFTGTDSSATSKANAFTRKNYAFTGFKAKDKQGNYLKDKNGKEIVFKSTNDFIEYLHKQGDGGEITLVAQWKKLPHATYIDPATGRTIQVTKQFNDDGTEPLPPADPTRPGYIFAGWDRTVDGEGNVVYKAMWEPDKDYGTGKKGSDSNSGKSASTGDASSFAIPIILLIAAGCGASAIVLRRRRRNESN